MKKQLEASRCLEVSIQTVTNGSGDPVVLLSGSGGNVKTYDKIVPILIREGFQTVVVHPRGSGESRGPLVQLTMHDLATDVAGVIQSLGVDCAHVVGNAFGNRVARCLATDYPQLVRTVVLLGAGGYALPEITARRTHRKIYQTTLPFDERFEAFRTSMFSPSTSRDVVMTTFQEREHSIATALAHGVANRATPPEEWLLMPSYHGPVLIIQGLDDVLALPTNGRYVKEHLGERVTLVELENAGHVLVYEHPERVGSIVASYLREHST
jgi:pimeloyl-ACP methyl ester carboxylesterase